MRELIRWAQVPPPPSLLAALESALRQSLKARWSAPPSVEHAVQVALARKGRVRVETLASSARPGIVRKLGCSVEI